jgi:hypothetical protein
MSNGVRGVVKRLAPQRVKNQRELLDVPRDRALENFREQHPRADTSRRPHRKLGIQMRKKVRGRSVSQPEWSGRSRRR